MNEIIENQNQSGSVDPLAQIRSTTAEEMEKNKTRKAELEFRLAKRQVENQKRKMAELKEAVIRNIRGEVDYYE